MVVTAYLLNVGPKYKRGHYINTQIGAVGEVISQESSVSQVLDHKERLERQFCYNNPY